ncbi:hypothetical protein [Acidihalobacter yilgarnensis]|uniref:hypothetical protein n=1 Tax=Acidihalobacter yilgarnensis TaxID=2819280 RepID=UPI0012E9FB65|nr:hypothetical protein [Acidihalobacter yilgarnensis]
MMRLATMGGATLGSWLGWDLGQPDGTGLAIALSSVGTVAGVILGWWLVRRYLE